MEKICWANTDEADESEFVIIGIPDEVQSHSLRKGAKDAPQRIRQVSNLYDAYKRDDTITLARPFSGSKKRVCDIGDIKKDDIKAAYEKISTSQIPIAIGGDHSITACIIDALAKKHRDISLAYFDAHPDFISSARGYHGSVIADIMPSIDMASSIQIGVRSPEQEELDNIKKYGLQIVTPCDVTEHGVRQITDSILDRLGDNVYISFDMDSLDPAYAPGVSVPVPLGLNNNDALYMLKEIIQEKRVLGVDVMEVCPNFDINDRTSHMASRIIGEVIYTSSLSSPASSSPASSSPASSSPASSRRDVVD